MNCEEFRKLVNKIERENHVKELKQDEIFNKIKPHLIEDVIKTVLDREYHGFYMVSYTALRSAYSEVGINDFDFSNLDRFNAMIESFGFKSIFGGKFGYYEISKEQLEKAFCGTECKPMENTPVVLEKPAEETIVNQVKKKQWWKFW